MRTKSTYFDLIDQTYYFPQDGFDLENGNLFFNNISLKYIIDKYGTPLKITYLPKIGEQIKRIRNLFSKAIKTQGYRGQYKYCYCTKSSHFSFVVKEALKYQVQLETSSAYDLDIVRELYEEGTISKDIIILNNGFKTDLYLQKIKEIQQLGFKNCITVLDSMGELDRLLEVMNGERVNIGIRMAIDEEPQAAYYTSRLGIRASDIVKFYNEKIKNNPHVNLELFHFFVDSGIKDNLYFWGVFRKALASYAELKKQCESLHMIDLGGGLPIRNNLSFDYDYKYIVNELVRSITETCTTEEIDEPDIITEFGKYTVGESGAVIFKVVETKQQNDTELWYLIDNSLMTTIPDSWGISEKFILLPINKWDHSYQRVNIGGITCDHADYYNTEDLNQQVYMPCVYPGEKEPLYIGFFHTGAYQDSLSGYGGIKHCLIPSPKHVVINRDENGQITDYLFNDEQSPEDMLRILGYNHK
ncbi:MAG: arginine decarboxylase [Marinilabiliaceae bacterium]|nr:arginine decarboxylase [Bacteroidales bacterium]MBR6249959.1 arginine decarboxylase [Bacteroidales bacterium]MCR5695875.1 arginine decarboxylase [Marinilabiliaceae bacterium]